MKLQASELPIGTKPQTRRKTPKIAPLIAITVLLTIPLYYPCLRDSSKRLAETSHAFESLQEFIKPTSNSDTSTSNPDTPTSNSDTPISKSDIPTLNSDTATSNSDTTTSNSDTPTSNSDTTTSNSGTPTLNSDTTTSNSDTLTSNSDTPPTDKIDTEPVQLDTTAEIKHEKVRRKRPRRSRPDSSVLATKNKDSALEEKTKRIARKSNDRSEIRSKVLDEEKCDLFTGEWVPNPEGPYYTNTSCNAIQEHQNCLKFGRPDTGFLKWRWKPDDCELPIFDPQRFLEQMRGKSLAFVGDSVARNHMQSLLCLLSKVAIPQDLSDASDQNKRYEYREHNFNVSMFWAPYLVKTGKTDPNDDKRPFKLYLDEFDQHWTSQIPLFDYVIISAGHWFFRPTYFYLNDRLVGCLYCPESNVSHLTSYFSYRRAFRTALRAINGAVGFNGVAFLRTFAPSHFEGAPWDKGGDCVRTGPSKRNETVLEDYSMEMYLIQLEELRIAQRAGRRTGGKRVMFRLFDATKPMMLRPDGHPGRYGHWPVANQTFANDCVHWCLPGPIDSWNDFLQELLKREILGDGT